MPNHSEEYNFGKIYPLIASEWNYKKNKNSPDKYAPKSNFKAWWLCENNHEWETSIRTRTRGRGCPYCSGRKASPENNISVLYPKLRKEWHPSKNDSKKPEEYTKGSQYKVWWKCEKGHEWKAIIASRTGNNRNCPYCWNENKGSINRKAVIKKRGSLASNYPEVAKEWHPSKNLPFLPNEISSKSSKKVWWKCARGHEWGAIISNRTSQKSGCPFCKGQTSKLELRVYTELKFLFKDVQWRSKIGNQEVDIYLPYINVGIEVDGYPWHKGKEKNDRRKTKLLRSREVSLLRLRDSRLQSLNQNQITYENEQPILEPLKQLVKRLTDDFPATRTSDTISYLKTTNYINEEEFKEHLARFPGPPDTKSLSALHPEIANEWDYKNNSPIKPDQIFPGSNRPYFWICSQGHSYKASVKSRSRGTGCKICGYISSGEKRRKLSVQVSGSIKDHYPEVIKMWNKKNDRSPDEFSPGSHYKAWWKCKKGHEWQAVIIEITDGHGCPYCAGKKISDENKLTNNFKEIAAEWNYKKNYPLTPDKITRRSGKKVWWICVLGHEWEATVLNRTYHNSGCPFCSGRKASSENNISVLYPNLEKEWHPSKNGSNKPEDFTKGSHHKAWWLCYEGHSWQSEIRARTKKSRQCPKCKEIEIKNDS